MNDFATKLMFDKASVRETADPNARLMRIFFFKEKITYKAYLDNYLKLRRETHPHLSDLQHKQKAAADRKFIMDPRRVTPRMCQIVLAAMGYIVQKSSFGQEESSVELLNTNTGEVCNFSSNDVLD